MSTYTNPQKLQGETVTILCSFLSRMVAGETALTCASSMGIFTGEDPDAVNMLYGDCYVQSNASDVVQDILGGIPGVIYILYLSVRTTLNNVLVQEIKIAIQPSIVPEAVYSKRIVTQGGFRSVVEGGDRLVVGV